MGQRLLKNITCNDRVASPLIFYFSTSFHQHVPLHRFKGIIYTIPSMSFNRRLE